MGQAALYGNVTKCPRCGGRLRPAAADIDAVDCDGECHTRWFGRDLHAALYGNPFEDMLERGIEAAVERDGKVEYIAHMLHTLEQPCRALTAWEDSFLESVGSQFADRGSLSDKQLKTLERIYGEKAE